MKRIIALVLTLAMVFALCACGSNSNDAPASDSTKTDAAPAADAAAAAPDKTYELKFAYTLATDHEVSEAFEAFAAGVKEATNGGVVITTYPAGAMGTQPENLESVMTGSLDMCYADTSMLPTYVPAYNMINLPWLITNFDIADELFYNSDIIDKLDAQLSDTMNMTALGWCYQGFRSIVTNTPCSSAADCKGVKLRSPETQIYQDTFSLMGFTPVVITWTEAYTAMQSGVVDGVDTIKSSIHSYGFDSMANASVWVSNHMFSSVGIVINNDVLAGLPQEYQDALFSEWEKAYTALNERVKEEDASWPAIYEEAGANVTYTENPAEFLDIFADYYQNNAEQNGYTDLLPEMLELINSMVK